MIKLGRVSMETRESKFLDLPEPEGIPWYPL